MGSSSRSNTLNNRYRLDQQVGAGGFARVFVATDLELGRQVAVKILEQHFTRDKDLLRRFRDEARTVATLDHPHILAIYDYGISQNIPYLVMPYINGGTLEAHLRREHPTLDEIATYLEQMGEALDYAHQLNIVHRDIKPSNMLIRKNGQLVLMDFGLAKVLQNIITGDANATLLGTVGYLAPEQVHGVISAATDTYMLSVVLYQMLTGSIPFQGNTTQVLLAHLQASPPSLIGNPAMAQHSPAVVKALDRVIQQGLAKNSSERFSSGKALFNAYYAALATDTSRTRRHGMQEKALNETLLADAAVIASLGKVSSAPPPAAGLQPGAIHAAQTVLEPASHDSMPAPYTRQKVLLKPACISVITEPDQGYRAIFDLTGTDVTLGRASDNQINLPLSIISRHHILFKQEPTYSNEHTYKIVLHSSVNHLFYKELEVAERVLQNGDVIEIGQRKSLKYIVKLLYHAPKYGFL